MRKAKNTMPLNPREGQLWYDPYLQRMMRWQAGKWIEKEKTLTYAEQLRRQIDADERK